MNKDPRFDSDWVMSWDYGSGDGMISSSTATSGAVYTTPTGSLISAPWAPGTLISTSQTGAWSTISDPTIVTARMIEAAIFASQQEVLVSLLIEREGIVVLAENGDEYASRTVPFHELTMPGINALLNAIDLSCKLLWDKQGCGSGNGQLK